MKELELTYGKIALLDDDDYERLKSYNYCYRPPCKQNPTEHVFRNVSNADKSRRLRYLQQDVLQLTNAERVKYIDGNRLNFQKSNLLMADISRVQQGIKRPVAGKSSRFVGVGWNKQRQLWRVKINHNKKEIHIGFFDDEIKAAQAYNEKALEIYGEHATLNIIEPDANPGNEPAISGRLLPRSKKIRKNKSQSRGVSHKGNLKKPWMAMIAGTVIGYFETEEAAAAAYDRAALERYGDRAILNSPPK